MKLLFHTISIIAFMLFSCDATHENDKTIATTNSGKIKDELVKSNQFLAKAEKQNIQDFITRYGYKMQETGSGLYYEIYEKGSGKKAKKDLIAEIAFKVRLLTGELVYSSETGQNREFLIGKGGVESGLEEGILLMNEGDKARFIIPSHLAFGLIGDLNKIPEKATIVYDLELIKLK